MPTTVTSATHFMGHGFLFGRGACGGGGFIGRLSAQIGSVAVRRNYN
jgi:hypothetical protein